MIVLTMMTMVVIWLMMMMVFVSNTFVGCDKPGDVALFACHPFKA